MDHANASRVSPRSLPPCPAYENKDKREMANRFMGIRFRWETIPLGKTRTMIGFMFGEHASLVPLHSFPCHETTCGGSKKRCLVPVEHPGAMRCSTFPGVRPHSSNLPFHDVASRPKTVALRIRQPSFARASSRIGSDGFARRRHEQASSLDRAWHSPRSDQTGALDLGMSETPRSICPDRL